VALKPGPVTRALLDLVGTAEGDSHDDRRLARRLVDACVAGTGVDGAAVSALTASVNRETLAATDTTAALLEDLQFTLGEGACLQAATTGRAVLVPDLHIPESTVRWPVFAAAVAEQTEVRALFALPLQLGTINLGVLDLYRTTPGPLVGAELRDVVAATDATTLLMLGAQLRTEADRYLPGGRDGPAEDRDDGLWDDRAEVHQATGMILVQLDVPAQDAFVRLRAHAFAHRRPVAEVARDVVAGRLVFTEEME
jgi:ANTAR domain-containing protein/GAF domain-containing protein